MQFALRTTGAAPDLAAMEHELAALDPAVLLDFDDAGRTVRISTSATAGEILAGVRKAGIAANADDLVLLPSECCGGCGG